MCPRSRPLRKHATAGKAHVRRQQNDMISAVSMTFACLPNFIVSFNLLVPEDRPISLSACSLYNISYESSESLQRARKQRSEEVEIDPCAIRQ